MSSTAELGFSINSAPLKQAIVDLEDFADAARDVDTAAGKIGPTMQASGATASAATDRLASAMEKLNAKIEREQRLMLGLHTPADRLADSFEKVRRQADAMFNMSPSDATFLRTFDQRYSTISREEHAWNSLRATIDPVLSARLDADRVFADASRTASASVATGVTTQDDADFVLRRVRQQQVERVMSRGVV